MPIQATVFEKYRDVDEMTTRHRHAATTTGFSEQQTFLPEIRQLWSGQKHSLQYFFDEGEIIPELATGMGKYTFTTAVTEAGVTYILTSVVPSITFELEQEIDVVVRMSPKAVRNTIVRVTARSKGTPNPIL